MLHPYGTTRSNVTLIVKSKPSSEARQGSPVVTSNVHQVSQPCDRNSSGIHFNNVELVAQSLRCITFAMIWWPFLLQLTSNRLQPTPEGPKPDTDRSSAIQTHTAIPSFLLQFACGVLYRQTASKLNSTQFSWSKRLLALFISSVLHRFYLFITITVCYRLNHCIRFMHLHPLTAVPYYSSWVDTYLEEEEEHQLLWGFLSNNNNNNLYSPQLAVAIDNTERKTEIQIHTIYREKNTDKRQVSRVK